MNHGYRDNPSHPHVHWQIFPRYKQPYTLKGIVFEDNRYGSFYDDDARRPVDEEVVEEIVRHLKTYL